MGNTSVVASGVKSQGDSGASQLYKLVDLQGGGELVELMKRARWTKNYKEIDEKIKNDLKKFLYNEGDGKKIPIVDLVMIRNRDREKSQIKIGKDRHKKAKELAMIDMHLADGDCDGSNMKQVDRKYREQCWKLDARGTVGESILHLCLLNSSAIHADLAKRLLQAYPKLVNDIYTGEEYYGEHVLHMAIVNEDPAMVKFLLDHNADYHARAVGNFFCPDDQKDSRTDSLEHEWVDVTEKTNYEGHVAWGEYPLSFAACLGQEECVRLLIAKGADPNMQDTNGNTVMHMLVIIDKKEKTLDGKQYSTPQEMFDLIYGLGGRLDIKNRQGLTPLTLAAKLARKDMYEHILEIMREVFWVFGNVTCAAYPLGSIDTISPTGEINNYSALNLIVYGEEEGHLDMMDGLVVSLLKEKWKTFARFRFYRRFFFFALYFILMFVVFYLRPGTDLCGSLSVNSSELRDCSPPNVSTIDPCYLLKAYRDADIARMTVEVLVLLGAIFYIFLAMKEIYHQGFLIFFTTLTGAPAKALFLLSCVLVVLMLPCRAFCAYEVEDVVGVLAVLLTSCHFLFFFRSFSVVGPFVVMIYKMIKGDLLRFFIIYAVFVVGFSQAMYILFTNKNSSGFSHPVDAVLAMFVMSLGQFGDFYESFADSSDPNLTKVVFIVYMVMVTLLLVNMLIAMMGNTYQLINNTQKEYFRQWAKIVLVVEQSVTTEERREQMHKYSSPMPDGSRALPIRWHQSEKEKKELQDLREKSREQHKLQSQRKKTAHKQVHQAVIDVNEVEQGHVNI